MIVYVAFEFPDVQAHSDKGADIIAQVYDSLDTMGVAFDASECWVSSVIEGAHDAIQN